jgi:hypothetical protein
MVKWPKLPFMMPASLATMALSHCIENRKLCKPRQMAKKIGRENSTQYLLEAYDQHI